VQADLLEEYGQPVALAEVDLGEVAADEVLVTTAATVSATPTGPFG
jgi:Zn-dependent alcohol dehydrogenase